MDRKFKKLKKYFSQYFEINKGFEIPNIILYAIIFILPLSILLINYFLKVKHFLISYFPPHNNFFDEIYRIFDPSIIVFFSGMYVFSKYIAFSIPDSQITSLQIIKKHWKKIFHRFALSLILLLASLLTLYIFENVFIKPMFKVSRPIFRIEHSVANYIYVNGYNDIKLTKDFSYENFICPVLKELYSIKVKNPQTQKPTKEELLSNLKMTSAYKNDSNRILNDLNLIVSNIGNYNNDINFVEKYELLKRINNIDKSGLKLWLSDLIDKPHDFDHLNSTPSGFVMRQILICFLALLLFFQNKELKRKTFIKYPYFFFSINLVCVLFVFWSRLYGFRHTLFDEILSLNLIIFLIIILLFFYYKKTRIDLIEKSIDLKEKSDGYEKYFNNVEDCFYKIDDNDLISSCNESFETTFGFETGKAIGVDIKELYVFPDDRKVLINKLKESEEKSVSDYLIFVHKYKSPHGSKPFFISIDGKLNEDNSIEGTVRKMSKLIEKLVDGFFRANDDGIIKYCNEAFAEIFGYKNCNVLINKKFDNLYENPEEHKIFLEIFKEKGEVTNFFVNCKKIINSETNESIITIVEVDCHYIDKENPGNGIEGTIREMPFALALYSHSFHGIFVIQKINDEFIFTSCNKKLLDIFGYDNEQEFLYKIPVKDIVVTEDWDFVSYQLELKLSNVIEEIKEGYNLKGITKDGKIIPLEVNSSHFPSYRGNPAVVGNIRDISEDIKEQEQSRIQIIETSISQIKHEVLNSLNGIRHNLQLIEKYKLEKKLIKEEELFEIVTICLSEIESCIQITEYLGNLLQDLKQPMEKLSLKSEIENYISNINITKDIRIINKINLTYEILGNKIGLNLLIRNLLNNSIESITGTGEIEIYIETSENNFIPLCFRDNGNGIDSNIKNNIYKPRVSSKKSVGHKGYGLCTVKAIIESWGGKVSLIESPEPGTTFELLLPLSLPDS